MATGRSPPRSTCTHKTPDRQLQTAKQHMAFKTSLRTDTQKHRNTAHSSFTPLFTNSPNLPVGVQPQQFTPPKWNLPLIMSKARDVPDEAVIYLPGFHLDFPNTMLYDTHCLDHLLAQYKYHNIINRINQRGNDSYHYNLWEVYINIRVVVVIKSNTLWPVGYRIFEWYELDDLNSQCSFTVKRRP